MHIDKNEYRTLLLSIIGLVLFTTIEGILGLFFKSFAILTDAIFDLITMAFTILTWFVFKSHNNRTKRYIKMEKRVVIVRCCLLIFSLVSMLVTNVILLLQKSPLETERYIFFGEFALLLISILFYSFIYIRYKREKSLLVECELINWKTNIVGTIAVGLIFLIIFIVETLALDLPLGYLDSGISIFLSFYLLIEPIRMIIRTLK